ncbi:hypothetical protein FPRO04_13009 [Fusarium proliferatum]|nr:hypothetical protein FPRO04_13009 [Fusarium proliferatum]
MSSDTSPIIGATENPPYVNGLPSNFLSIMDITKDRSNTHGRKTGGKTIYTCTACGDKRYDHKANAANHIRNNHPVASRSTRSVSGTQRSISAHFRPVASEDALRNAFNPSEIKDSVTTASSPIHISTDLWISPHRHSLLAVCAQWVDKVYKLRKALLSLPECAESHSGEAQAQAVIDTLEKYGIQSKLGWHTGDNATSNDTCLESIQCKLMSRHKIKFNVKGRHIRCIAPIINLSLQAFLLASSKEALVAALESASGATGEELLSQFSEVLASHRKKAAAERNTAEKERRAGQKAQAQGQHG